MTFMVKLGKWAHRASWWWTASALIGALLGYTALGAMGERLALSSGTSAVADRAILAGVVPPTDVVASYGPESAHTYALVLALDMIVPVLSDGFTALVLARSLAAQLLRGSMLASAAVAVPVAAILLDWIENAGFALALALRPDVPVALAWVATGASAAKWVAIVLSYLLVVAAALARSSRFVRSSSRHPVADKTRPARISPRHG